LDTIDMWYRGRVAVGSQRDLRPFDQLANSKQIAKGASKGETVGSTRDFLSSLLSAVCD